VDKVVVNVQVINMDRIVCIAYSDGSFDYRDRITLQELYTIGSLDKIMHVSQIGFSHSGDVPCKFTIC
jgi:mediator of RNA polymerase II transcription subunit 16